MTAIAIKGVTKRFGPVAAVNDLTLTVPEGEIYGFIGPNGAGKTTTIRMAATLLEPDRGEITVFGKSTVHDARRVRKLVGYMPDFTGIYQGLLVREYLEFFAACYGIPGKKRRSLIDDLMALTDLTGKAGAVATSLSRGMKQRLSLSRALIHDPRVLLLDEPASGLDPRARIEIRELLRELARMGKTIFISSHILSELEELCDRVGILEKGRLRLEGRLDELMSRRGTWRVEVREDPAQAGAALREAAFIEAVEPEDGYLRVRLAAGAQDAGEIAGYLAARGIHLTALGREAISLEDAFLEVTDGSV